MSYILPAIALLVGELCLRHYHQLTMRRALPMELRAETRALSWDDIKDKYRIVCLGDSITYGEDLPAQQAYPAVLDSLLSDSTPDLPLIVINSGIRGNTAVQGLERVERDVLWYKPHAVVIAFGWNDARLGYWPLDPLRERQMLGAGSPIQKIDSLLQHSHLWLTVRARARRALRRLGWTRDTVHISRQGEAQPRVSRQGFEIALSRLIRTIRARGCPNVILLTTTPVSERFMEDAEPTWRAAQLAIYVEFNRVTRDVASSHNAPLVDLHEAWTRSADLSQLVASDGIHLTAAGEHHLAVMLHQALVSQGVLETGPMLRR